MTHFNDYISLLVNCASKRRLGRVTSEESELAHDDVVLPVSRKCCITHLPSPPCVRPSLRPFFSFSVPAGKALSCSYSKLRVRNRDSFTSTRCVCTPFAIKIILHGLFKTLPAQIISSHIWIGCISIVSGLVIQLTIFLG